MNEAKKLNELELSKISDELFGGRGFESRPHRHPK